MMKRMKGVAPPLGHSQNAIAFEDLRTRFKHQSLMQDYEDLLKETGAMREKLQMMKQRRFTLKSEVGFLRQRYKYLMMQNCAAKSRPERKLFAQSQGADIGIEFNAKGKKRAVKRANSRLSISSPDLNKKRKMSRNEKEAATPASVLELNQIERISTDNEALVNPVPFPDMNQTLKSRVPVFDLNQVSRDEEEEPITNVEQIKVDGAKKNGNGMLLDGKEEQQSDIKLSLLCRNVKNRFNPAGKRKVSWQDPVALRV